ncbi:unnamed protein product [Gongylonema pulchrum]|uniref:Malectin domain-containing protein n=1 Tax=Gongylonema pulchrum TaxID=637853 RepID=A0A183DT12_9BILA|nr:unnamed protein product [Gongylonema pulchrum]
MLQWLFLWLIRMAMASDVYLGDSIYEAINCGGPAHTDVYGIHYEADPLRIGTASDYGIRLPIMKVDPHDAILYQTERYHTADFTYTMPVPADDGEYTLVLKFCEVYFRSSDQKVVIPELDIFKEAGGIGVAYDRLITFYVKKGILIVGNRRDTSSHLRITFAKDIPPLQDVLVEGETDDEIEDEELDLDSRVNMHRFEDEPLVADPYTEQDTNHMFIPFLVAFACFFPILFCLCKL